MRLSPCRRPREAAWLTAAHRNVAELFKTPGKLRGKTPRTARKAEPGSVRVVRARPDAPWTRRRLLTHSVQPLSDVFSATPKGDPNPFAISHLSQPRSPRIKVAEDKPEPPASRPASSPRPAVVHPPHPVQPRAARSLADSGYHGSQSQDTVPSDHFDKDVDMLDGPPRDAGSTDPVFSPPAAPAPTEQSSPPAAPVQETGPSTNDSPAQQATANATASAAPTPSSAIMQPSSPFASRTRLPIMSPRSPSPAKISSPVRHSPQKLSSSPQKPRPASPRKEFPKPSEALPDAGTKHDDNDDDEVDADVRSPSDGSSPIRPIVRKSSLNFASLPAREPLASKKSLGGARMSRTSQLDFSRSSYYSRRTGGKSLGGGAIRQEPAASDDGHDEMDVDDDAATDDQDADAKVAEHSRTYTQRLQDQISMLGKGQSTGSRPSKSLANLLPSQQAAPASQRQSQTERSDVDAPPSPKPKQSAAAPGAFPEDDDDHWISPPGDNTAAPSPKNAPSKSSPEAAAETPADRTAIGSTEFVPPAATRPGSPSKAPGSPVRPNNTASHGKSVSVPALPAVDQLRTGFEDVASKKTTSASDPMLDTVSDSGFAAASPKSPTRDNPLKQVKNKLTSLLKSSKGLIASSAAISAEGKTSLLQSPVKSTLGSQSDPSIESFKPADSVVYPDLSQHLAASTAPLSPVRSDSTRRTRASLERERQEAKERERAENEREMEMEREREREREREKEKEEEKMREAQRMAEQIEKLEKARVQEREKARVFNKEQEKMAAVEKQSAAQKEQDKAAQARGQPPAQDLRTPGPPPRSITRSPTKTARTPPPRTRAEGGDKAKKTAGPSEELDLEAPDTVATTAPPPSVPRPTTASSIRTQSIKRPVKPTKEALTKSKQAPTVIRVNTTSSQHTQFHPSNSVLAATLQETLGQPAAPARPLASKASHASLHNKPSLQSLKSSVSSTGRPKALELAAKRKEQVSSRAAWGRDEAAADGIKEERDAQQKREAKLEMQRKRAAQDEERRQEQQRKLEAERQKEEERRAAQARKAAIEKAKQTKAPPPAPRSQPNGPPDYMTADKIPPRPPSRLGSAMHQEGRLVNTVLSSAAKGPSKRPLQQDASEESSRSQQQRAPAQYPSKEAKRMRMSEEFDEDIDMVDSHSQRTIKGPPVRPSGGFKKVSRPVATVRKARQDGLTLVAQDLPTKSTFASGSRDLFKPSVTGQHGMQAKAAHPLDMAQVSKGTIPFAPNPGSSNSQGGAAAPYRTPGRPGAGASAIPKSAKSSPRFQNGELIELPDIETDDDSDDGDGRMPVAAWADSPQLRAALLAQERVDPMQVFGPPAPLNMEEVFSKSKDRWHKFRARTSSANWSGADRLTEEDIRKDMAARDRMRREGGWSYELSKEMA